MKSPFASHCAGGDRGVGLVEILVGVAIIGVLMAAAIPSFADFIERRRIIAAAGELSSFVAFAKSESNVIGTPVNLHLEDDPDRQVSCAALTTYATYDRCKCYNRASQICPSGSARLLRLFQLPRDKGVEFTATAASWAASNQVLTFHWKERLQAEKDVKITVTGQRTGVQLIVKVNEVGLATTCSPVGRFGGFPTC